MRTLSFWQLIVLTVGIAVSAPVMACGPIIMRLGLFEIREVEIANRCYLRVHPLQKNPQTPYRDYLLSNTGEFVVFNYFGAGASAPQTGVRLYTFLPRQRKVAFGSDKKVISLFSTNPNVMFRMDADVLGLKEHTGVSVTEDPEIKLENDGGVELEIEDGVMLDSGFAFSTDPRLVRDALSTFTDTNKEQCPVQNTELFRYQGDSAVLKFSDRELRQFLSLKCPHLRLW